VAELEILRPVRLYTKPHAPSRVSIATLDGSHTLWGMTGVVMTLSHVTIVRAVRSASWGYRSLVLAVLLPIIVWGCAKPTPPTPAPPVHDPVIERELMIRDLSVVNDPRANTPDGPWSFGGLIKAMAGPTDPSRFVVNWLKTWETDQTINGFVVDKRVDIRTKVIEPWKVRDGQAGVPDDTWTVNLANAPMRLLAIVNRIDLTRGTPTSVLNAGEGRFVFGVLKPDPTDPTKLGGPMQFTVIFEYEQVATSREQLRGWARQWHALGTMPFGPAYNIALQQISDRFSGPNKAPLKPHGNALNQLRTNEIELVLPLNASRGWELREFNIKNGFLTPVTTKQSPANQFHLNPQLTKFIDNNEAEIKDGTFDIPVKFDNNPFLAGSSIVAPPPQGFFWKVPSGDTVDNQARHMVALGSCNGCHHRETATTAFLHVGVRQANAQAELSGFLQGDGNGGDLMVEDPINAAIKRPFNDLKDRAKILKQLAGEVGDVQLTSIRDSRRFRVH